MISAKEASGRDQAGGAVGPGRDLMMSLPSSGGALQPNPLAQGVHHRALALLHHRPRGVPEQPGLAGKLLELNSSVRKGRLCASWKQLIRADIGAQGTAQLPGSRRSQAGTTGGGGRPSTFCSCQHQQHLTLSC